MTSSTRSLAAMAALGGLTALVAVVGGRTTARAKPWYRLVRKSPLNPPDAVFGPVWAGLYGLGVLSAYRTWSRPPSPERTRALALFVGQLALNANWTREFFGKRRGRAAFRDLLALSAVEAAYLHQSSRVDSKAPWMVLPYLGWLAFAGYLNREIIRRNPRLLVA
jgi:benzodiazapine receptor